MSLPNTIIEAVKEGLSLWKVFIETRQQAYNRKMDKRKAKAIEYGEKFILTFADTTISPKERSKLLKRYRTLFFKYNN